MHLYPYNKNENVYFCLKFKDRAIQMQITYPTKINLSSLNFLKFIMFKFFTKTVILHTIITVDYSL